MTDWLCKKHKCSRKKLISRKLDSKNPISINDIALVDLSGISTHRTKSPMRHDHPYLEEIEEETFCRQREYLPELPEEDPHLVNAERRDGWSDAVEQTRERDGYACQSTGCEVRGMEGDPMPVYHIRRRKSKEDDRPGNLVTLCLRHHDKIHRENRSVEVYHEGRGETLTLN